MRRILSCIGLFLFIVGLLHSCIAGDKQKAGKMDECTENVKGKAELRDQQFPFPEIPSVLTSPTVRKTFLLTHYWDSYNFSDTALVNNRAVTESKAWSISYPCCRLQKPRRRRLREASATSAPAWRVRSMQGRCSCG